MPMDKQAHIAAETLLMDYAAGALDEAQMLLIATHLSLSPAARHMVREFEAIAGAMLSGAPPAGVSKNLLDSVLKQIETLPVRTPAPKTSAAPAMAARPQLPHPLCDYLDCDDLMHLRWQRLVRGISYTEVRLRGPSPAKVHLLRLDPGATTPAHHHDAAELTLVLDGAFRDEFGQFSQGDVSLIGDGKSHGPLACPSQGCVCLTVGFAPGQISTLAQRLLGRFFRF